MNINMFKQLFLLSMILLLLSNTSSAQIPSSNNTLGSTGITSIQSGTANDYKLSIGGATKVYGEGNPGASGSATLIIGNTSSGSTGGGGHIYGIHSSDAGNFQIYDSLGTTPSVRFNITPAGNVGIGTTSPLYRFHVTAPTTGLNSVAATFGSNDGTGYGVTIGTGTVNQYHGQINSQYRLELNGGTDGISAITSGTSAFSIGYASAIHTTSEARLKIKGSGTTSSTYGLRVDNSTGSNSALVVRDDGKVGIGTSSPAMALDVISVGGATAQFKNGENSNGAFTQVDFFRPNANTWSGQGMSIIALGSSYASSGAFKADGVFTGANAGASGGLSLVSTHASGEIRLYTGGVDDANQRLTIKNTGKVGIGTATPSEKLDVNGNIYTNGKILINQANTSAVTPYALAVNGTAIFTKAVVKLNSNWPDYVFEPEYGLLPIAQLEKYVQENKHLPGIPAAAEVSKEGIDLGNTQTQQLQKIEELTLYIIELNRKIEALQKDNETIKKQLNTTAQKN